MNTTKLTKLLTKEINEQYTMADGNGHARIDQVIIDCDPDGNSITLIGAIGAVEPDGKFKWQRPFEVRYPDGKSYDYIIGAVMTYLDLALD